MATKTQQQKLRRVYDGARKVNPRPITGKETSLELLEHAFGAYVGRQERIAFELMKRSLEENAAIFLTLSGAMTPAGLHQSCLIPLVESGAISAVTTTGANLYHDAHRIIRHQIREINPNAGDLQYRLARIIRIYDLGFWEEALLDTDRLFSAIISGPDFQR
nr:deoxyhypusine synthase family protein [Myxococcaceae bacterium]